MKFNNIKVLIFSIVILITYSEAFSQSLRAPVLIHSQNDYNQSAPFYKAWSQKANSLDVNVFLHKGKLIVGNDCSKLDENETFEQFYLIPIQQMFKINNGRLWKDSENSMQIFVKFQSDPEASICVLDSLINIYRNCFDSRINKFAAEIVITGNKPDKESFCNINDIFSFDGDIDILYDNNQLERIALFSDDFKKYSYWNGKGSLISADLEKINSTILKAHKSGKPIRFWNAPEGITAYYTFYNLGVDYFSTEHIEDCVSFFSDFSNKNFEMGRRNKVESGVTGTKKLDKATNDFGGFNNDKLQLSGSIDVYNPTYLNDGVCSKVKNVILMIGDGMGLNQITAGAYANQWLSLLNMKHLGLAFNNAADAFTTDSAAGGSALGTGIEHKNRTISIDEEGNPIQSLSDYFHEAGYSAGVLTLGDIADATPAVFYGHAEDRDSTDKITRCLLDCNLDLLCGSGIESFENRNDGIDMTTELSKKYDLIRKIEDINLTKGKTICIDERMREAANENNLSLLADATVNAIKKLDNEKGFFLMVEGAKIDYAGHSKCLPGAVIEMLSFDKAVAEAMKFADSNGETLIIVTADHETGGLTLLDGDKEKGRIMGVFVTDDHTPTPIPVFSYGPESQLFQGVLQNVDICNRIISLIKK